jgi:hypothetical protein
MSLNINDDFFEDGEDEQLSDNQPLLESESHDTNSHRLDGKFPKARQIFALVGFFGFAVVYAMRVNLSISIVSMTNHQSANVITNQTSDECPIPPQTNSSAPPRVSNY